MKYEIIEGFDDQKIISRQDENGIVVFIPTDPSNSDYQRYLRWLENPDADEFPTIEVTQ